MLQPEPLGGQQRSAHDERVRPSQRQAARVDEELLAADALEFAPQRLRSLHERHVPGRVVVGVPHDARVPVGAALVVRELELLKCKHPHASAREMERGRAAHGAYAYYDDIPVRHAGSVPGAHEPPALCERLGE